jgi:membrane protein DedA with SNARE-associated domain
VADLTEWASEVIEALGATGVLVLVALESVFPPIPSEAVLASAGFVAGRGDATFLTMLLAATLGSMLGAWLLYGLGSWLGPDRIEAIVVRHGRWLRITTNDVQRAERWFDRHAMAAVTLGRCVPLVRSVVSVPAGFRRMPLPLFSLCTFAGSLVWNSVLISIGYVMGDQWETVERYFEAVQAVVLLILAALVIRFVARRLRPAPSSAPTNDPATGETDSRERP